MGRDVEVVEAVVVEVLVKAATVKEATVKVATAKVATVKEVTVKKEPSELKKSLAKEEPVVPVLLLTTEALTKVVSQSLPLTRSEENSDVSLLIEKVSTTAK